MAHPTSRMSTRELLPLVALTLSAFLLNTSEFVPIGLLTDIAGAFSLSESGAGAMISIYAWAVALLSLPLMLAASRVPPRALIVSVLAVFCGGQVASALAPTFELLVASRLIVAAAHAVFWSVASPFAVRVAAPERSALAMSMIVTGTSVAMIFGLPLGRALGLALGWRMTFVCVGAAAAAALAGLIAFFPRLEAGEPFTLDRLPELARNRALMGLYLATILFATGYYTGYSYIEPFLQQVAAMPDALITAALTVFGVAGLVGSGLFARFFDAHRRPFLTATMLGMAAALLLLLPSQGCRPGPLRSASSGASPRPHTTSPRRPRSSAAPRRPPPRSPCRSSPVSSTLGSARARSSAAWCATPRAPPAWGSWAAPSRPPGRSTASCASGVSSRARRSAEPGSPMPRRGHRLQFGR